jgi:N-acyl-D-aspartate/D-glutamate deacylase
MFCNQYARRREVRMGRLLLQGGVVFDGTGVPPTRADVVIANGRIVDIGTGLDGDDADCQGRVRSRSASWPTLL